METFEAVRTLLAVRTYQDKPISDDVLHRILEAGRLTGSASNRQPWHFIVVKNRETLTQLSTIPQYGSHIAQAPLAIVVAITKNPLSVSDGSRAIQSMLLTAWEEGIGSNWVGFTGMDAAVQLLGLPDDLDVLAILPFGYPAEQVGKGNKKRKPLSEIASSERFGQPVE